MVPNTDLFPEDDFVWPRKRPAALSSVVEWIGIVAVALVLSLAIKAFAVQAFYIPSASMVPTLVGGEGQGGDRVLVNKLSYHLHEVNRGDVVVFENPEAADHPEMGELIKRIVGLPGDTVEFRDGRVYIDDSLLDEPYLPPDTPTEPAPPDQDYGSRCTTEDPCTVPDDSVWVMGDNRTDSRDSRYLGPIPTRLLVGRAFLVVWPPSRLSGL